jgi:phosphinothricin acetyltransferase
MGEPAILIRPAAVTDAAAMRAIYAPIVETTAISFEDVPPTIGEMAERIETTLRSYPYLVA